MDLKSVHAIATFRSITKPETDASQPNLRRAERARTAHAKQANALGCPGMTFIIVIVPIVLSNSSF